MLKNAIILPLLSLCLTGIASAELILTAPPRESVDAGAKLYGPIAEMLSNRLGQKVTYRHPQDWKKYEKNMKQGNYDIIFDGPHFAAWRIESAQAEPLVKLPGVLDFSLVVKKTETNIKKTRDLVGKKLCTLPSPNLGAMSLYAMFPNPTRQPEFVMVRGGMKQIAKKINDGTCIGGIMRRSFFKKKLDATTRNSLNVMENSEALTNQGITVNRKLPATAKLSLLTALTDDRQSATQPLFDRFASKSRKFIPANTTDYENQNLLRENMIFGW